MEGGGERGKEGGKKEEMEGVCRVSLGGGTDDAGAGDNRGRKGRWVRRVGGCLPSRAPSLPPSFLPFLTLFFLNMLLDVNKAL